MSYFENQLGSFNFYFPFFYRLQDNPSSILKVTPLLVPTTPSPPDGSKKLFQSLDVEGTQVVLTCLHGG